jgi:membrane protein implicated in regulation of membrane protease activity
VTDWIIWIASGLVLLIAEMLLPGAFLMWLGLAACGAGMLTAVLHFDFPAQVVAFGVLAAITLSIGLRLRRARHDIVHTESAGLVGRPATALVFHGVDGRVRLGDTDWAARVPPDIAPPAPGARLRVAQVEGTILIVRPDDRV